MIACIFFSVDYDIIDINDIISIHKYIMKKHEIKKHDIGL